MCHSGRLFLLENVPCWIPTSWKFPFQLFNSPLIDAYCPLIECSRYVIVRRCSDLCAFDRMHCLIWIKFCEARGIYPIAHAVGLWSVCLCISFTTTENVRVWRIVQDGMNWCHCKESKRSKIPHKTSCKISLDIHSSSLSAVRPYA